MELSLLLSGMGAICVGGLLFVFRARLAERMNRSLKAMWGGLDNVSPQLLTMSAVFFAALGVIFVVSAV